MRITDKNFFTKTATELAPALLGKYLCRNINGEIIKLKINETEAYVSQSDTACHAHKGKTARTEIMWHEGGVCYIYLCYGVHEMLNIVSGKTNEPEAVLIRGVEEFNGPGKLTKKLKINRTLNAENLLTSDKIWIEDNDAITHYITTKRIGIEYADEKDRNKLWRFVASQPLTK